MKKIKFLLPILLVFSLCIVFGVSCANSGAQSKDNDKISKVKVGESLPDIPVASLGLGELYPATGSEVDTDANIENATEGNKKISVEYYSSSNQNKELHVSHYENNKNYDLETFTQKMSFQENLGHNNYRMGTSEVYALSNHKIDDGYYVKMITDKSGSKYYICQQSVFQDGDKFVILSYLYLCTGHNISGTNVNVSIPIIDETTIEDGVYSATSKSFYYEKNTELPTISYYTTNKTIDQALRDYDTSYNATTEKNVYEGTEYGIAKEQNSKFGGGVFNVLTVFVKSNDGRTAAVELKEPSDAKTYAFDALINGLYIK